MSTLTVNLPLHPGPPSRWVCRAFYGGPLDGEISRVMDASLIKGKIELSKGTYQLQGFKNSAASMPAFVQKFAMDYAIYEWEGRE